MHIGRLFPIMKTYHVRENVKKRYLFDGALAVLILAIFIIACQRNYSNLFLQIVFAIVLVGYAALHVMKFKTCRMILKEDELEFHDGMLNVRKIPYKDIRKIEYNPEILMRFYLKEEENYTRILNVFSREDTEEIFSFIRSKNPKTVIDHIDKNS